MRSPSPTGYLRRLSKMHASSELAMSERNERPGSDFIRNMIARDLSTGKYAGRVVTRFPPEPNGYLHIGHAKSICLNFGLAAENPGGRCHLRFDDTNPTTEDVTFVDAIKRDIRWLGFDWEDHLFHASDYFEQLFDYAVELVQKGLAYVDSSTEAEIQELRGSVKEAGRNSPHRGRSVEENLDLLRRMRSGEFGDGEHVVRAKIDMAHPNMIMRDPVLIRIRHAHHYRQGDDWCIYPLYDFAHCLSDSIERVTHSLCTLEFENNRAIYDWLLHNVSVPTPRPEQTEFARLNLEYTITSKRKLKALVEERLVAGWDDPRMPTIAGLRRRGVTPSAIRSFCEMVGVAKSDSRIDMGKLEFSIRDDLNYAAPRAFAVLRPLRVVITNYPEATEEVFEAPAFPPDVGKPGSRQLAFARDLYIDAADFREDPPPGFRRLVPGGEVRLKYAYVIRLEEIVRDPDTKRVVELRCTYDPDSKGGTTADGRRVRGTIQWVSAAHAISAEIRLYEPLFLDSNPDDLEDFRESLNPDSEVRVTGALVEPGVGAATGGSHFQFERLGYFFEDPVDSAPEAPVFNRTVSLRDTWSRKQTETVAPTPAPNAPPRNATQVPRSARDHFRDGPELDRFDDLVAAGVDESIAANLAREEPLFDLYSEIESIYPKGGPSVARWLVQEIARELGDEAAALERLRPAELATLVRNVDDGLYTHHQGRRVLASLVAAGGTVKEAETRVGLNEGAEEDIADILADLFEKYADKVEAYRAGQTGLLGFFVGQVMKQTKGNADPKQASEAARKALATG